MKTNKHGNYGKIPWNKGKRCHSFNCLKCKKYIKTIYKNRKFCSKSCVTSYRLKGKKLTFIIWNKGLTKKTDERVKKYGKSHKGLKITEKTRKRLSESHKGQIPWMTGKKHTKESKDKIKKARAKQILPFKDTSIEVKIQNFLKELGIEYFTHQYIKIEHSYQCDILIPSMNLVIECDGDYWHKYPIGLEKDHIRTKELINKGFKVLRLWEHEINNMELNKFKEKIKSL